LSDAPGLPVAPAATTRPTVAVIDPAALQSNVELLVRLVAPAEVMVVVKADGYGHGAVPAAAASMRAGAVAVGVALVDEAVELRRHGFEGTILVLSEPPADALVTAAKLDVACTLYSPEGVAAAGRAARIAGRTLSVHLKVDTGMHRVGVDLDDAPIRARSIADAPGLELAGTFTHLAVADDPADPFTGVQLDRFEAACAAIEDAGIDPGILHAANSAAAIAHPRARFDLVRIGIAAYGELPAPGLGSVLAGELHGGVLQPVLSLRSRVHLTRRLTAGERTSYGQQYLLERDSTVVTVPIGYADGLPRSLAAAGGEVLIGGRRRPIAGTVTMDQIIVDVGDDDVAVGDEVVLIGSQGDAVITAAEWAERTGTLSYEILARLGTRIPRTVARVPEHRRREPPLPSLG
jgi:alanine racemase